MNVFYSFIAWHVRLQQYYKSGSETEKNNQTIELSEEPVHEYRESKDVHLEKPKKKHDHEHNSSFRSSDSERRKHKKRSHSKTRKRSLSKSSSSKDEHDGEFQAKKRKSDSSPVKHATINGKDINHDSDMKKKQTLSPKDRKPTDIVKLNSKETIKHISPPASSTNNSNTHVPPLSSDSTNVSPKSSKTEPKIHSPIKSPLKSNSVTPKKSFKKNETKSPVDLLDKIMRDMDGKNWN